MVKWHQNGVKQVKKGCQTGAQRAPTSASIAKGFPKDPPVEKYKRQFYEKTNIWSNMVSQRISFGNHFGSKDGPTSMHQAMPKKLRTRCQKGSKMKIKSMPNMIKNQCQTGSEQYHANY
jgi:hypothetical protein